MSAAVPVAVRRRGGRRRGGRAAIPVGIVLLVLLPLILMPLAAIFVFAFRGGAADVLQVLSSPEARRRLLGSLGRAP